MKFLYNGSIVEGKNLSDDEVRLFEILKEEIISSYQVLSLFKRLTSELRFELLPADVIVANASYEVDEDS